MKACPKCGKRDVNITRSGGGLDHNAWRVLCKCGMFGTDDLVCLPEPFQRIDDFAVSVRRELIWFWDRLVEYGPIEEGKGEIDKTETWSISIDRMTRWYMFRLKIACKLLKFIAWAVDTEVSFVSDQEKARRVNRQQRRTEDGQALL